jgi:hypothetical protein
MKTNIERWAENVERFSAHLPVGGGYLTAFFEHGNRNGTAWSKVILKDKDAEIILRPDQWDDLVALVEALRRRAG